MVYVRSGQVLYVHEGALLAQTFDVDRFRLTGEPRTVADGLDYYRSTGAAAFSVSDAGVLAYHGGGGPLELVWFNRRGTFFGPVWNQQLFGNFACLPTANESLWKVIDPRLGTSDIWIHHLSRGVATRFTTDLHDEHFPVWSPDGQRIIFGSDRGAGKDASSDFFVKASDGMGPEELFLSRSGFQASEDWSRDGQSVAYMDD